MSEELKGNPDFSGVNAYLRERALEKWHEGDYVGILGLVNHYSRGELFEANIPAFRAVGAYEAALYATYIHGPYLDPALWRIYFEAADSIKLRACGDPLPAEPICVYRGIRDANRRVFIRALSWTTDPHIAAWFATRGNFANPAVYSMIVNPEDIFLMTSERAEAEVMVAAWRGQKLKRLAVMPEPRKGKHAGEEEGV